MLPSLRTTLRTVSYRNQSLQDILKTCKLSKEVIQVLPIQTELHNTILITRLKTGKIRTHYYNRLDLGQILEGIVIKGTSTADVIHELNTEQHCDFTEEDVEVIGNKLVAKVDSLGYIGHHSLSGSEPSTGDVDNEAMCAIATDGIKISPDLYYGHWDSEVNRIQDEITWKVEIDGILQPTTILSGDSGGASNYLEDWLSETFPQDFNAEYFSPEEGSLGYTGIKKISEGCASFKLIPSQNFIPVMEKYLDGAIDDISNNPSFKIHSDGTITFSLMGVVIEPYVSIVAPTNLTVTDVV